MAFIALVIYPITGDFKLNRTGWRQQERDAETEGPTKAADNIKMHNVYITRLTIVSILLVGLAACTLTKRLFCFCVLRFASLLVFALFVPAFVHCPSCDDCCAASRPQYHHDPQRPRQDRPLVRSPLRSSLGGRSFPSFSSLSRMDFKISYITSAQRAGLPETLVFATLFRAFAS